MSDDDLDALLDEALQESDVAEKKAEKQAVEEHASRDNASRILNATLMNTGGESHLASKGGADGGAGMMMMPPGMENPEQLRLMMTQLTAILTQTQQLESVDPNSPEAIGQEEKLLEMAKSLISHAQNNVEDAEEKAKIDSTMKALQRVQQLTQSNNNNNGQKSNPQDDPSITAELQKISEELQGHVEHSRSQVPGLNAAFAAATNQAKQSNQEQQHQATAGPMMSEQDRLQFEAVLRQMQSSGVHHENSSSAQSPQLSSEQQAALFAMLMAMKNEAQQQENNNNKNDNNNDEVASPAGLAGYYNLIFAKFSSIDIQYDEYFSGRGKVELSSAKISQSDFDRFAQQQAVVKKLLDFKEKQQAMMDKVIRGQQDESDNASVGELNSIVERLRQLGDPPAGFDV